MNIALITGASRGIGRACALELARRGSAVIVTYRTQAAAAQDVVRAIQASGGTAVALALDVADTRAFAAFGRAVDEILAGWGRATFDHLVHNAGFGMFHPIGSIEESDLDALFAAHLKGPLLLTQELLPRLADGGHIITLSSATVRSATAGVAPYAALKSGLETLTRYLAKELGPRRIRANAVAPGAVRTELAGGIGPDFEALLASQTALSRIGEPEDVALAIAGLLSDDQRWVNAQCIEVSGGYLI